MGISHIYIQCFFFLHASTERASEGGRERGREGEPEKTKNKQPRLGVKSERKAKTRRRRRYRGPLCTRSVHTRAPGSERRPDSERMSLGTLDNAAP